MKCKQHGRELLGARSSKCGYAIGFGIQNDVFSFVNTDMIKIIAGFIVS